MKQQKKVIIEKVVPPATSGFIITEEQKALVEDEYRKFDENPNYGLDWAEVKHRLNKYAQ